MVCKKYYVKRVLQDLESGDFYSRVEDTDGTSHGIPPTPQYCDATWALRCHNFAVRGSIDSPQVAPGSSELIVCLCVSKCDLIMCIEAQGPCLVETQSSAGSVITFMGVLGSAWVVRSTKDLNTLLIYFLDDSHYFPCRVD